jgi:NTP pyrophosphatase (non-canonical NTP hydrolase)
MDAQCACRDDDCAAEKKPEGKECNCCCKGADLQEGQEQARVEAVEENSEVVPKRRYSDYYYRELNQLGKSIVDWRRRKGFHTGWDNVWEKLCLVVSEVGETVEGLRHLDPTILELLKRGSLPVNQNDAVVDNIQEEIADIFIRLMDLAYSLNVDLADRVARKMQINEARPHKHGKQC